MLSEIEIVTGDNVVVSQWTEYPWGPCVKTGKSGTNVRLRQVHCRTRHGLCLPETACPGIKPPTSERCDNHVTVRHWYDFDPASYGTNIISQKCYSINLPFDADASSRIRAAVD